ncbi:MAG: NAD(P)-dependent oxidoreductase [Acidobacteriaceae bacterium]|nr:NAD(P)-dependent oxidoreductase [Acidobacteriaceae bacterium]
MNIGFIGLGSMGNGLARNLMRAGHNVVVYNRTREKAQALERDGARAVATPAEAAQNADAVFTMLADDNAVADVTFGAKGFLPALGKTGIHISCSTISIAFARKLAAEHSKAGSGYISAPVFGRPEAAAAAKLLVVTAGPSPLVERAKPLLSAIGRETYVAGPEPWQANLFKLCGNFMIASMCETFGEAFATLRKAGTDHTKFLEVMIELFGSPVYKNYGSTIADGRFEPAGFALKLGLKDIRLGLEAAGEFNSPMPFASLLRDHFWSAMAHGQEELDWSSVSLVAARAAGLNP